MLDSGYFLCDVLQMYGVYPGKLPALPLVLFISNERTESYQYFLYLFDGQVTSQLSGHVLYLFLKNIHRLKEKQLDLAFSFFVLFFCGW